MRRHAERGEEWNGQQKEKTITPRPGDVLPSYNFEICKVQLGHDLNDETYGHQQPEDAYWTRPRTRISQTLNGHQQATQQRKKISNNDERVTPWLPSCSGDDVKAEQRQNDQREWAMFSSGHP